MYLIGSKGIRKEEIDELRAKGIAFWKRLFCLFLFFLTKVSLASKKIYSEKALVLRTDNG